MMYDDDDFVEFINHLTACGFVEIDSGCFRVAFMRGKVVVKVPLSEDGLIDNMVEARGWRTYKSKRTRNHLHLAPCRLLPNGCLMMVKVDADVDFDRLPAWADRVDGQQVGYYKGRLVAFDYALDLTERFKWEKEWETKSDLFHSEQWEKLRPHIHRHLQRLRQKEERLAG